MLTSVRISQFRAIALLEAELDSGLTVVTGETGAGKSVLIDALSLAAGARAGPNVVRVGADRADVVIVFTLTDLPKANDWLQEHELDADGRCVLRRTVSRNGRSQAYVNGVPVTIGLLREIGGILINLHRQNEQQRLLQRAEQMYLLDAFGGCLQLRRKVGKLFMHRQHLQQRIDQLDTSAGDMADRLALLDYQLEELERLQLAPGEVEELDSEFEGLAHASEYRELADTAIDALYENDNSLGSGLERQLQQLGDIGAPPNQLKTALELLTTAHMHVEEAVAELRAYRDGIAIDPDRLQVVEARIAEIHDLARKHRLRPSELRALMERLSAEKSELESDEVVCQQLREELRETDSSYREAALLLRSARTRAAGRLGAEVTGNLHDLGMPGGSFQIRLSVRDDQPTPAGLDDIDFLVSGGAGQKIGRLAEIASGGELARISLALQLVIADRIQPPTLVFDEADVGIGGGVGEMVGRMLRSLANHAQVLCVTHLPQVAVQGRWHFRLLKSLGADAAITEIQQVANESRTSEIARMMGGIEVTSRTMDLAREMLGKAAG